MYIWRNEMNVMFLLIIVKGKAFKRNLQASSDINQMSNKSYLNLFSLVLAICNCKDVARVARFEGWWLTDLRIFKQISIKNIIYNTLYGWRAWECLCEQYINILTLSSIKVYLFSNYAKHKSLNCLKYIVCIYIIISMCIDVWVYMILLKYLFTL